uniref:Uncharacterized protein n=1 Tax=Anopheles albimanus TaxID=7167 RepID=A0A1I8JSH6_ANOAL
MRSLPFILAFTVAMFLTHTVDCRNQCRSDEEFLRCGNQEACFCRPGHYRYKNRCLKERKCYLGAWQLRCRANEVSLQCGSVQACFCNVGFVRYKNYCYLRSTCTPVNK